MPTKKNRKQHEWEELDDELSERLSHLASWYNDTEAFAELRLKARPDGTTLAIAKGYDSAGGPIVSFGSGYGLAACLLALNSSIQGGNWRVDKPWTPPGKTGAGNDSK